MDGTLKSSYKGWDITVRCLKFQVPDKLPGLADCYTASGHAVLQDAATDGDWIDARIQALTLHGQIFDSAAACADALLAQMRELLDSLKRLPPRAA